MKRWVKVLIVSLILLIAGGVLLFDVFLEGILKTKLESMIQQQDDRIYDYKFEDIHLQFIAGEITLSNVEIIPRNRILDSLKKIGILKKDIYHIRLEEFRLEGLDSWKLILENKVHISTIIFDSPNLRLYSNKNVNLGPSKDLAGDIIAPSISSVVIDVFEMRNARFEVFQVRDDTTSAMSFDSTAFIIEQIVTDSAIIHSGEILRYEKVEIDMNNVNITSMKDYRFEMDKIQNNFEKRELHLIGLKLSPRLDKYEFMKSQEFETDWFSIVVDSLTIKELDVPEFQKSGKIIMSSLNIKEINLELYRDKRLPDPPSKIKFLPSRLLREFETSIDIDEIAITRSEINYYEWEHEATQPIVATFGNCSANVYNFTTNKEKLIKDDTIRMDVSSSFMTSGKLKANVRLPILDSTDLFFMSGSISNLPLADLNPIMQHSAFIKFEEGQLNNLQFYMRADDISSDGWLDLDYEGLKKVQIIRNKGELDEQKEKGKKHREGKKILSVLANTLVPNEYNPESKNYYRGKISFERNRDKSIFNYLAKSVQTGVITSLMPSKQENYKELKKAKKTEQKKSSKEKKKESKRQKKNSK